MHFVFMTRPPTRVQPGAAPARVDWAVEIPRRLGLHHADVPKRFRGMMKEGRGKAGKEIPKPAEVVPQYIHGTGNNATPTAAQRKAEARGGRAFLGCIREHSRCICVRGGESCFRARGESCRSPLPTTVRRFPGVYGKAPQAGFL